MKRMTILLLTAAMLFCLAACTVTQTPAETADADSVTSVSEAQRELPRMVIDDDPFVVTAGDGFENAGFTGYVCDATGTYTFVSSADTVLWTVFVLDEAFPDEMRYLVQEHACALEGDGKLDIEEGKYIYILCSENGFTADEPSDACLTVYRDLEEVTEY